MGFKRREPVLSRKRQWRPGTPLTGNPWSHRSLCCSQIQAHITFRILKLFGACIVLSFNRNERIFS